MRSSLLPDTDLCTWDIQPQCKSFSSKPTQGRFWPAGLWGHTLPNNVPQQTPDLVIRSATRHSAVLGLLLLQQGSWEQCSIRWPPSLAARTARKRATFPPVSKGFTPDLHFSSLHKIQSIYDEVIDVPQSTKEDSQCRANAQLITQQGREKTSEFSMADVSCDVISTHRLVKKKNLKKNLFSFFFFSDPRYRDT